MQFEVLQIFLPKRMGVDDPLSQTYGLASSEHCFRLKFVFLDFEKWGRTDRRTTCAKTNDYYRP